MQGTIQTPKAPLGNNARPLQQIHHRTVRTNIDFQNAKVVNFYSLSHLLLLWPCGDSTHALNLFIMPSGLTVVFILFLIPLVLLLLLVFLGSFAATNPIISVPLAPLQNQNCPSMHKDMYYKGKEGRMERDGKEIDLPGTNLLPLFVLLLF